MGSFRGVSAGIAVMTLWTAAASGLPHHEGDGNDAIQRFQTAVHDYMALREAVTRTVRPLEVTPDTEDIARQSTPWLKQSAGPGRPRKKATSSIMKPPHCFGVA